jgi:curved DNA-binding protein
MAVEFQDYYKTLGVERDASQQEIQKAYRKMARKYHPDVSKEKNAEDKFKKASEAYEILKNPESRKKYDALGQNWKAGEPFVPPSGWQNAHFNYGGRGPSSAGFSDFFDVIFGQVFDQGGQNPNSFWKDTQVATKGEDQTSEIAISLDEAFSGIKKEVVLLQGSHSGHPKEKRIKIKIPPGTVEGTQLRFKGQGQEGRFKGPRGDLYLRIKLLPHPIYRVSGHHLHSACTISPWEAALGVTIEVATLSGKVNLKIPAGSSSGAVLRLKGKGLPLKDGSFGDLHVTLKISVPKNLTTKEKALFEELASVSHFNPRPVEIG